MSVFGNLTNDGLEETNDRLGGFNVRDTNAYEATIKRLMPQAQLLYARLLEQLRPGPGLLPSQAAARAVLAEIAARAPSSLPPPAESEPSLPAAGA